TFSLPVTLPSLFSTLFPYTTLFRSYLHQHVSELSHRESACANGAISAWPRHIHRSRCIRSHARDSSLAAPPAESLCLRPGCEYRSEEHTSELQFTFRSRMPSSA